MSICFGPAETDSRAGATAAPCTVVGTDCGTGLSWASGSRMSAPSPLPNAFLGMVNDLLGELRIALSALAMDIIENNWLTKTWCLGKAHVARNYALEDLGTEETAQIG